MKRCLSFLPLLFLFVFGAAAPDAGPGENAAHLYAGRPQLLPFEVKGEFVIRTRHGRILGSGAGAGQLTVQVPEGEDFTGDFAYALLQHQIHWLRYPFQSIQTLGGTQAVQNKGIARTLWTGVQYYP